MKPAAQRKDRDHFLNALFFLALLIFIVIAVFVLVYPENGLDSYIQEQVSPLAQPPLFDFWIRISFFGSFEFLFPAYLVFIILNVWQRKVRFGLSVAAVAIGGFLSVQVLKLIFQRHRPPTPLIPNFTNYSFPSGHSTSTFIFCAVLIYSLWHIRVPRSLRISGISLLILLTCSVGLSRIVLVVHYPTDVAAGFCLGTLWIIAWFRFIKVKI
jgi:membrane-associated phospholipid phosphatase